MSPRLCWLTPIAVATLSSGALVALGLGGWPGETGVSGLAFCEALRPGAVKQPANTFSNLGFVAVALWIGLHGARNLARTAPPGAGPMRVDPYAIASYAGVAAFLGPGSAAMHASTTSWGGKVDVFSMYVWVAWMLAYVVARAAGWGRAGFTVGWLATTTLLGLLLATDNIPIPTAALFGWLVAGASSLEIVARLRDRSRVASLRYALGAGLSFFPALAVWLPSQTGGPLCAPDSWLQGHALWHLLAAVAVAFLYLYAQSERSR